MNIDSINISGFLTCQKRKDRIQYDKYEQINKIENVWFTELECYMKVNDKPLLT